jgi:hypothetical protein
MRATTRRSLRRAWYLAANWQVPAHIGFALGMGLALGLVTQRFLSGIILLAAVLIGIVLYPVILTVWWRLNR